MLCDTAVRTLDTQRCILCEYSPSCWSCSSERGPEVNIAARLGEHGPEVSIVARSGEHGLEVSTGARSGERSPEVSIAARSSDPGPEVIQAVRFYMLVIVSVKWTLQLPNWSGLPFKCMFMTLMSFTFKLLAITIGSLRGIEYAAFYHL